MKYLFIIVFVLSSQIYSQIDSVDSRYALSFGIRENFTLSNFNMDIAIRKVLDNTNQMRFFISPRLSSKNDVEDRKVTSEKYENISFTYSLGVGTDYIWILSSLDNFNMYSGTGMSLTFANSKFESKYYSSDGNNRIDVEEESFPSINIGLRGILGVEWKVSNRIGIHSEYLMILSHTWRDSEIKSTNNGITNSIITKSQRLLSLNTRVLFGISIYM